MIIRKTDPRWKLLVTEGNEFEFQLEQMGMLVHRLNFQTKRNPESIDRAVDEAYNFCVSFEKIVTSDLNRFFYSNKELISC